MNKRLHRFRRPRRSLDPPEQLAQRAADPALSAELDGLIGQTLVEL